MKIVAFSGSPRKNGNTNTLINEILKGSKENGHDCKLYILDELDFKGCQGCRYCKIKEKCVLEDDMTPLYDEIKNADVVILGSPNYMGDVTGQTKLFLDRWYAFKNKDFSTRINDGKKAIWIFSQGAPKKEYYMPTYEGKSKMLSSYGFDMLDLVVATSVSNVGDVKENTELMNRAHELGNSL